MYWEEMISKYYKKPTYAFDCGVRYKDSDIKSEYLTFCSECIGTDAFIFSDQISSGKIHTLKSKINELGIQDKKIYLRFEIPQLQKIIPEVIENKDNITGITIIRDYWSPLDIIETLELLKLLNKDFALVSRNFLYARDKKLKDGKLKYTDGSWSIMVELTYVNKNILDEYYIPLDQSNYKNGKPSSYISMHLKSYKQDRKLKNVSKNKGSAGYYKYNNISPIVVIHKKISRKLQEIK